MSIENGEREIPVSEPGLGWLVKPTWKKDPFGEIAGEKKITPEVMKKFEGLLAAAAKKTPEAAPQTYCSALEECGTFQGGPGSCNSLKKCTTFTNAVLRRLS